jgi:DNA-binding MarR family transcriptional regulator
VKQRRKKIVFLTEAMLKEHRRRFPETFDHDGVQATFSVRALAQRINDYANAWLAPLGLNAAKYNYLAALYFHPGGVATLSEITRLIHTSHAAVTLMINALVKDGLVQRLANPRDRRSSLVRLTPKGKRIAEQAVPLHCGSIELGLRDISAKDRKELVRLLLLVNAGFERVFGPEGERVAAKRSTTRAPIS